MLVIMLLPIPLILFIADDMRNSQNKVLPQNKLASLVASLFILKIRTGAVPSIFIFQVYSLFNLIEQAISIVKS